MMRDRNGRELRVKDRVVVFSGSRLIPILARVATRHELYSGTDFIAAELIDGSHWFTAVLSCQVESLEPCSTLLDRNGFELRVGDEVRLWDGGYMQITTIHLLYYLRDYHHSPFKRTTPPTE